VTLEGNRRLNWGCGSAGVPGWINSDKKRGSGIDISVDIRQGLPLASDGLDYAVSVHALTEIPYDEVVPVLSELRRVIKPGGVLRLAVPDIDRSIDAYRCGDAAFFMVPDRDARSIGAKFILQLIWYGYSRTFFNRDFIEELLYAAGFSRVAHVDFRQTSSQLEGITELDNRENESLFVEAYK
jgi:SAM-dependent methyltransferase